MNSEKIRIGWIGSPSNAKYLQEILEPLTKIQTKYTDIVEFNFVCRSEEDLCGLNVYWTTFEEPGFDYHRWFGSIHIGLAVYPLRNQNAAFKTSMKSLEYWASKTALISGPFGISDAARDGVNASICEDDQEWFDKLEKLITDKSFREEISLQGHTTFLKYHSFYSSYKTVKKAIMKIPSTR